MDLKEEQLERTQEIIADDNFVYMGDNFFINIYKWTNHIKHSIPDKTFDILSEYLQ